MLCVVCLFCAPNVVVWNFSSHAATLIFSRPASGRRRLLGKKEAVALSRRRAKFFPLSRLRQLYLLKGVLLRRVSRGGIGREKGVYKVSAAVPLLACISTAGCPLSCWPFHFCESVRMPLHLSPERNLHHNHHADAQVHYPCPIERAVCGSKRHTRTSLYILCYVID